MQGLGHPQLSNPKAPLTLDTRPGSKAAHTRLNEHRTGSDGACPPAERDRAAAAASRLDAAKQRAPRRSETWVMLLVTDSLTDHHTPHPEP